jgi:hypothetical protein
MSAGLALGAIGCGSYGSIRTKADVMKFALEGTVEYGENGKVYNYDKAKELFEFFCANVPIMETDVVPIEELLDTAFGKAKEYAEWFRESKEQTK